MSATALPVDRTKVKLGDEVLVQWTNPDDWREGIVVVKGKKECCVMVGEQWTWRSYRNVRPVQRCA